MCEALGADASYNILKETFSEVGIFEVKIPVHYVDLSKKTHKLAADLKETVDTEIPILSKGLKHIGTSSDSRFETLADKVSSTEKKLLDLGTSDSRLTTLDSQVSFREKRLEKRFSALETLFGGLTKWPGGFYGLLQPKTG